jgi:thiol:disulfide interchange protein
LFGLSLVLSPLNVIVLYLLVGIGMASPFLVLCFYPGFSQLLPKPGAWMDTLKQVLAFPLLLTAVFFVASIDQDHRIATLVLLIVVWFACWLIGKVPGYAEASTLRKAWLTSMATIALGAFLSFHYFGPVDSDLKWVDYNETELARYRAEGKTVMLDFTANWCLNCQINTRVAIDKDGVAEIVQQNDVVTMLADWTDRSEAIREKLEELQSNSIPLLVIYPPDPSAEPILLRDLLTESQVIAALEEAGPSRSRSKLASIVH